MDYFINRIMFLLRSLLEIFLNVLINLLENGYFDHLCIVFKTCYILSIEHCFCLNFFSNFVSCIQHLNYWVTDMKNFVY